MLTVKRASSNYGEANNNFGDLTNLSLSQAIEFSNQNPGVDTIRFAPNLTSVVANIIAFDPSYLHSPGEVAFTDSVNIEGRADRGIQFSTLTNTGMLTIDDGDPLKTIHVHISGVTFKGDASGRGGIDSNENLVLDNVKFDYAFNRGSINSGAGDLTITNATFPSVFGATNVVVRGAGKDTTDVTLADIEIPGDRNLETDRLRGLPAAG